MALDRGRLGRKPGPCLLDSGCDVEAVLDWCVIVCRFIRHLWLVGERQRRFKIGQRVTLLVERFDRDVAGRVVFEIPRARQPQDARRLGRLEITAYRSRERTQQMLRLQRAAVLEI